MWFDVANLECFLFAAKQIARKMQKNFQFDSNSSFF